MDASPHCMKGKFHDLYEYVLAGYPNMLAAARETLVEIASARDENPIYSFGGVDVNGTVYRNLLAKADGEMPRLIERLLQLMLDRDGVKCEPGPLPPGLEMGAAPMADYSRIFVISEECVRHGYCVTKRPEGLLKMKDIAAESGDISELTNIVLVDPAHESHCRQGFKRRNSREFDGGSVRITYETMETFFLRYFGPMEYDSFSNYLRALNDKAEMAIAFGAVPLPTESELEKSKLEYLAEVQGEVGLYRAILNGEGMRDSQIDIVERNFLEKKMCRALVGTTDFADSVAASEWLYNTHKVTDGLEKTSTAAGYLKSVEQLLYQIASLRLGEDRLLPMRWIDEEKRLKATNLKDKRAKEALRKASAWSLIGFFAPDPKWSLSKNDGLLDVDAEASQIIFRLLNKWRGDTRNGYFHKDNLREIGEIERIRANTKLLHFLILGACRINASDAAKLGVWEDACETGSAEVEDLSRRFREWVSDFVFSHESRYHLNSLARVVDFKVDEYCAV